MQIPSQAIGYILVILSAVLMGASEGRIIGLEFHYSIPKVLPIILIYLVGVSAYLGGLLILANRIGTVIGLWEAIAIGLAVFTAVRELTKGGGKFEITREVITWGILLTAGVATVIIAGDKFIGFFFDE